jgi:hypothetical protein
MTIRGLFFACIALASVAARAQSQNPIVAPGDKEPLVRLAVVGPNGAPIDEPNPTVGNRRGRVDILDLTVGATVLLGDRTTIASGFAFPLRNGDDRTFNWEYQLQVNYYFGASTTQGRFAPTFQ